MAQKLSIDASSSMTGTEIDEAHSDVLRSALHFSPDAA